MPPWRADHHRAETTVRYNSAMTMNNFNQQAERRRTKKHEHRSMHSPQCTNFIGLTLLSFPCTVVSGVLSVDAVDAMQCYRCDELNEAVFAKRWRSTYLGTYT